MKAAIRGRKQSRCGRGLISPSLAGSCLGWTTWLAARNATTYDSWRRAFYLSVHHIVGAHMSDSALNPRQKFTVSHLKETGFKMGGLRSYSAYRDLGIAAATNGLATAHVIRMIAPFDEKFSQRHHHDVEFQLVYVLKGL